MKWNPPTISNSRTWSARWAILRFSIARATFDWHCTTPTGNPSRTGGPGWGPGTGPHPSGKCDGSAGNQYTKKDDIFVRNEKTEQQFQWTSGVLATRSMSPISRARVKRVPGTCCKKYISSSSKAAIVPL
jgi:hypothetical protein